MGLDNFGQTILANPLARRTNLESVLGTDVTVDFNFSEKANSVLENEITISVHNCDCIHGWICGWRNFQRKQKLLYFYHIL